MQRQLQSGCESESHYQIVLSEKMKRWREIMASGRIKEEFEGKMKEIEELLME